MENKTVETEQTEKKLELPEINMISEWFSSDQVDRIERLREATHNSGAYKVYEVYNSKGAL